MEPSFSAKEILNSNFLVLSGDDIISKEDISLMLEGGLYQINF